MNREKILKASIWLSGFSICTVLCSLSLFIGFNNQRHGSPTLLIIGILLLPVVFYCAYKGFRLILQVIFD